MLKVILFLLLTCFANTLFAQNQVAIFAGGCFWCMQADFDKLHGVVSTVAGYDGGTTPNPTYEQVSSGTTNYAESVQVTFDPSKLTYQQLLNYYWHHIDPTVQDAQFCDHGHQYRTAIFYLDDNQKNIALTSLATIKNEFSTAYTEVVPSTHFYRAEDYHQEFYLKFPIRYEFYRWNCGRDNRVMQIWAGKS